MRRWKRIVAILLIAVLAFVIEGWASSAQGAETFFKKCTYTRTAADGVKPPFSLAPLMGSVKATVKTSQGSVVVRLDRKLAPCAVHSIVHLSLMGYYTDKTCPGRTAAYVECATASPGYRFAPELSGHESYPRGTVALGNVDGSGARLILVHHSSRLPAKYTVVGRITGGLPAVDRIARAGQPAWITGVQIG